MAKKHKLTPEQEAQLVIALTCLTKCKEIELAIMESNNKLMSYFVKGETFDHTAQADELSKALGQIGKLQDQLIIYRNLIEDRRTKGQINYSKMQLRLHGDDRYLEARYRDPKALIKRMAESIAAKRAQEEADAHTD